MQDGETVISEGPYVSVASAVGGYVVFEAESREAAVALAARVPAARLGGWAAGRLRGDAEVWPCEVYW